MEQVLTQICGEIHNFFEDRANKQFGEFTISGGTLPLSIVKEGQCVWIRGSAFNDGIHMYPFYDLQDETFTGTVQALRIPPELMRIAAEIEQGLSEASGGNGLSPYISESFGGYSYTKATDKNGVPLGWQTLYADRLNKWRKLP